MMKFVEVFAPATVANVGCGFDVFGFALDEPGDHVRITPSADSEVIISRIEGDEGRLPRNAEANTAGVVVLEYLRKIHSQQGISIELYKNMPLGSGMGSSAASAVAALVAINRLFDDILTKEELLPIALLAEKSACGTAHADNVAPALFGGFTLIRSYDPLDVIQIPVPDGLYCCLLHPDIEIRTEYARKILPVNVDLKTAVAQWGNTAGLIAGLFRSDLDLLRRAMEDHIVEPVRAPLIPYFYEVKHTALEAGAIGCSISGSGPTIFALCTNQNDAEIIADRMKYVYDAHKRNCQIYISRLNPDGPKILSEDII